MKKSDDIQYQEFLKKSSHKGSVKKKLESNNFYFWLLGALNVCQGPKGGGLKVLPRAPGSPPPPMPYT